jgi:cytochrome c oxidase subunit 2
VLIIIGMAWPATRTLLEVRDTSAPDMTIKATGFQWKWGYEYIDDGVKFYSSLSTPRDQIEGSAEKGENYLLEVDAPMVVPVGKKVRMLITSNDVLHSWYVPELAVNQDAIPGLIRDAWFRADTTGIFRGQCAKLCGRDHGFMPIVVKVLSEDDYKIWLAGQKASVGITAFDPDKEYSISELSPIGEAVYSAHCTTCHKADGKGSPPLFPAVSGGTISTGPVADHVDMVLNGSKKNPMMAAWRFQLSDMEIAAVVTYERNALGNAVGDVAQPGDVAAARDQTASK